MILLPIFLDYRIIDEFLPYEDYLLPLEQKYVMDINKRSPKELSLGLQASTNTYLITCKLSINRSSQEI